MREMSATADPTLLSSIAALDIALFSYLALLSKHKFRYGVSFLLGYLRKLDHHIVDMFPETIRLMLYSLWMSKTIILFNKEGKILINTSSLSPLYLYILL